MHIAFALPRHPLLRALLLVAGALVLAGLLVFGLFAGLAIAALGALTLLARRLLTRTRERTASDDVIEGEFRVMNPRPRARIG